MNKRRCIIYAGIGSLIAIIIIAIFAKNCRLFIGTDEAHFPDSSEVHILNALEGKADIIQGEEGEVQVSSKAPASVKVNYKSTLDKSEFYLIKMNIKLEKCKTLIDNETFVSLFVNNVSDYNRKVVTSDFSIEEYNAKQDDGYVLKRVIKTNKEGEIDFSLALGSDENFFTGQISIYDVVIIPIEECKDYKLIKSKDNRVRMVFREDDIKESKITDECLQEWIDLYSKFREDFIWLTGGKEPFGSSTDYILTETFAYYGLAGNPIYMNANFVSEDLKSINLEAGQKESNVLWGYVHEMSHTFDGIEGSGIEGTWNFDREFFATLKSLYPLSKHNYGMGNDEYIGEDIIEHFSYTDTLKNGIYSTDGFVYTFINTIKKHDDDYWEHLHNVFLELQDVKDNELTDNEKLDMFWDALNKELGENVEELLTENERKAISDKFGSLSRE